jgi:hypothetical protein
LRDVSQALEISFTSTRDTFSNTGDAFSNTGDAFSSTRDTFLEALFRKSV